MRAVFLPFLLLAACEPQPVVEAPVPGALAATGEVVGTVDDEAITADMVAAVESRVPPQQVERMKREGRYGELLDRLALSQVLYRMALEQKLHEDPEIAMALAMTERDVLASELVRKIGDEAVTDEAIAKLYDERKVQYARPAVRASHIVVQDLSVAEDLKKQLDAGADFAALAGEHSLDTGTRAQGGDIGWFEKERMFREISEPAFAATKGDVLGPIETRLGFHLVLVTDKREATPIEEVRPALEEILREDRVEEFLAEVHEKAKIEWKSDATPADAAPADAAPADAAADPHAGHEGH